MRLQLGQTCRLEMELTFANKVGIHLFCTVHCCFEGSCTTVHGGRYQSAFQASLWEPFAYSLTLNKSSGLYSFDNTTEEREREREREREYII